ARRLVHAGREQGESGAGGAMALDEAVQRLGRESWNVAVEDEHVALEAVERGLRGPYGVARAALLGLPRIDDGHMRRAAGEVVATHALDLLRLVTDDDRDASWRERDCRVEHRQDERLSRDRMQDLCPVGPH